MKLRRIKEILHVCEKTIDNYANRIGASDEIVEYIENLQSQLKAKEEENEQLKADYGNLAQVERDMLQQENKKYKEVIDKAIEFIYAHSSMEPPYYEFREFYNVSNLSELLDILKGVDND